MTELETLKAFAAEALELAGKGGKFSYTRNEYLKHFSLLVLNRQVRTLQGIIKLFEAGLFNDTFNLSGAMLEGVTLLHWVEIHPDKAQDWYDYLGIHAYIVVEGDGFEPHDISREDIIIEWNRIRDKFLKKGRDGRKKEDYHYWYQANGENITLKAIFKEVEHVHQATRVYSLYGVPAAWRHFDYGALRQVVTNDNGMLRYEESPRHARLSLLSGTFALIETRQAVDRIFEAQENRQLITLAESICKEAFGLAE